MTGTLTLTNQGRQTAERPPISAYLMVLAEKFPAVFDPTCPKPLAIGSDTAVAEALGVEPGGRLIHALMGIWTGKLAYVTALAAGGTRYRPDGTPEGIVKAEHQERARAQLAAPLGTRIKPEGQAVPKLNATARRVKLTTVLDVAPFVGLRVPEGAPRVELAVTVGNRRLTANLASKSVRRAVATVTEHGADAVVLVLQGTLGPGDEVLEAGLAATVKAAAA